MNIAEIFVLAIASAFYPTLLAVVVVILGRPHPKRLLTFFLAGAASVSLAVGLTAVFVLDVGSLHDSARRASGPLYLVAGLLALLVGLILYREPRRDESKPAKEKGSSLSQRALSHDSARLAFVLGIVLDLPSIWYLLGLKDIALGGYSAGVKVLLVVLFNVIMFALVEVPLVALAASPETAQQKVESLNGWLHLHGRRAGAYVGIGLGFYLVVRGAVELM